VSLVVACVLGFGPWGRRVVARLPGPWVVRAVLAVAGLVLVGRLVTLPFALAQQQHFLNSGLTRQAWSGYAVDMVKTELVDIVVTSIGVVAIIGCARRWRRAWPAVAGGLAAALVMLGSFVYPVVVEPLFNTFTALPDGSLRSDILELAAREHVHISDVEVADASRRTTTLNAYVTGFGATKRVVIYDTVVHDLTDSEILAIVSHELAHSRHDDVLVGSAIGAAGAAFGVGLLALVVGGVRRRPGEVADVGTVPLLLALMAIGSLLSSPVSNLISREIETRADVDGLLATRDPEAFIAMQVQLARHSLQDPTPPAWSQFWFGSHPTTLTRIAIAERLDGEPTSRNGGK
jgi:STE24 endopeptidase